jgi:hypothetical protein
VQLETVGKALAQVDAEIANEKGEIAALQAERTAIWEGLVIAAYEYLVAEFMRRFEPLRDDILAPIMAINSLTSVNGKMSQITLPDTRLVMKRDDHFFISDRYDHTPTFGATQRRTRERNVYPHDFPGPYLETYMNFLATLPTDAKAAATKDS